MSAAEVPWQTNAGGVLVHVRLTRKASHDAIDGVIDTADRQVFKARVRAVPQDGAANAALERLVADWLGVAKGTVALLRGGKSRIKVVRVAGDAIGLTRLLEVKHAEHSTPVHASG